MVAALSWLLGAVSFSGLRHDFGHDRLFPRPSSVELPSFLGRNECFQVTPLNDPGIQPSGPRQVSLVKMVNDGWVGYAHRISALLNC
jgi:hypothetical protein